MDYRMKTGCEAKITIRRILRYPCAEYNDSLVQGIAAVRRHRKQILDDLVQRIINGTAKFQERCVCVRVCARVCVCERDCVYVSVL